MVFVLKMAYVVRTKKGKRKKLIQACYFSKIITLIKQSLFLPAQPQKLKQNYCASLSLLWAFDQLTYMMNKMKFFYVHGQLPGVGGGGTLYNGLSGEAPHEEVPFSSLSIWKGVDLTSWNIWNGIEIYHFGL